MNSEPFRASISAITSYLECRRKYAFRYRDRYPGSGDNGFLTVGSAVHAAMEHICRNSFTNGHFSLPDNRVLWRANEIVDAYLAQHVIGDVQDMRQSALVAVRAGEQFLIDFRPAKILAVETETNLREGNWHAPGRIDLLCEDEYGAVTLIDWKTSQKFGDSTVAQLDPQTCVYAHEVFKQRPELDEIQAGRVYLRATPPNLEVTKAGKISLQSTLDWHTYLAAAREHGPVAQDKEDRFRAPWYRADITRVTREHAARVVTMLGRVVDEMAQNLPAHPNLRPKMCGYCEFQEPCRDEVLTGRFHLPILSIEEQA
jgi:hypothetical protein